MSENQKMSMKKLEDVAKLLDIKSKQLPINRLDLEEVIDVLFHRVLFPVCDKECKAKKNIYFVYAVLRDNMTHLMGVDEAEKTLDVFIDKLPELQKQLYGEARNFMANDPAARSVEEVILTYPGFFALTIYRLSHILHAHGVPLIPRLFTEYAHSKVGIDIHPGAEIGDKFFIDHGTGIVIGETTIIGKNVSIYQGVTLGALIVTKSLKDTKRHPTIGDNVVIYAGATILGGESVIGHDSTVGGNVWLTKSIKPHSVVFNTAQVKIKNTQEIDYPLDYSI